YLKFIGESTPHIHTAREEYLQMKVCLFEKADLDRHYAKMSKRFYIIGEKDDINHKQVSPCSG
ncbi:hypothetical protein PJP12_29850, partial [Mycobacterium kansasii]